jgi:hypothetical protein
MYWGPTKADIRAAKIAIAIFLAAFGGGAFAIGAWLF